MKPHGFTAAWLVAAALLASWAVSSASNERRVVPPADVPRALPEAARAVEAEVARLAGRRHLPSAAVPAGERDPFTFGGRYTGAERRVATAPAAGNEEIVAADVAEAPEVFDLMLGTSSRLILQRP